MAIRTEPSQNLTKNQLRVIPFVLACKTIDEALGKARVSRHQYYEWLKDSAFQEELRRQRDIVTKAALEKLKSSVTGAIDTLVGLLASDNENIRLRSSQSIIDHTLKAIELHSLEERIAALEKVIAEPQAIRRIK